MGPGPCALTLAVLAAIAGAGPVRGDDGQWAMASKDYANTRYSGLDQIRAANAKDLKLAWTFYSGVDRGQEAAPLVVGDTMYVVTPYPNVLSAPGRSRTRR